MWLCIMPELTSLVPRTRSLWCCPCCGRYVAIKDHLPNNTPKFIFFYDSMYSYLTLLFCQAVPSVRGFLLKDLKQCLRKEHCDVSEIQAGIRLSRVLSECILFIQSLSYIFLFLNRMPCVSAQTFLAQRY